MDITYSEEDMQELRNENKFLKAEIELLKKPRFSDRYFKKLEEENRKLREKTEKLEKELSAVYKAYHTALGVDYNNEEDLYTIEDIEGHNAE